MFVYSRTQVEGFTVDVVCHDGLKYLRIYKSDGSSVSTRPFQNGALLFNGNDPGDKVPTKK